MLNVCQQTLFKKNVVNEKLRESIGEALGAAVNTYRRMEGRAAHQVGRRISKKRDVNFSCILTSTFMGTYIITIY